MPVALHAWVVDSDGEIRARHTFFAETEEAADRLLKQHAASCPGAAGGETIEVAEEIDELPDAEILEDFEEEDLDEDEEEEEEEEVEK
jgi:hypothetical protein